MREGSGISRISRLSAKALNAFARVGEPTRRVCGDDEGCEEMAPVAVEALLQLHSLGENDILAKIHDDINEKLHDNKLKRTFGRVKIEDSYPGAIKEILESAKKRLKENPF